MSTPGFGDINFESDVGRAFTILVLLSGIVLLLIMPPFAFIRFFYVPWLEAQIHMQTAALTFLELLNKYVNSKTYSGKSSFASEIVPAIIQKNEKFP